MKCSTCKFWAVDEKPDTGPAAESTFSGAGECRRHAPRAMFEAPLAVASLLDQSGTTKIDPDEPRERADVRPWYERMAMWPVTYGASFCGEFAPASDRKAFV